MKQTVTSFFPSQQRLKFSSIFRSCLKQREGEKRKDEKKDRKKEKWRSQKVKIRMWTCGGKKLKRK